MASLPQLSIREELNDDTVVLVTGGLGFVGSLVVEQLLRCTSVRKVLLLVRARRGQDATKRLQQLVDTSPIFKLLKQQAPHKLSRLEAIEGDLLAEGLGLHPAASAAVAATVNVIVHSAAAIELEADIHATLSSNYVGTQRVLQLASGCAALRALVHVSSAYANANQPPGATVSERLYSLGWGDQALDPLALAQDLLNADSETANARARVLCARWRFPNTYALGKFLAEHLVARTAAAARLPVAIVRPSFVVSLAGAPLPGYVGNWAGPQGIAAAYAVGFVGGMGAVAFHPLHVYDMVPGDVVASVVLATAAAVSAGAAPALRAAADRGAAAMVAAAAASSPPQPPQPPPPQPPPPQQQQQQQQQQHLHPLAAGAEGEGQEGGQGILIVHACTSSVCPVTNMEAWNMCADWVAASPPPLRICARYPGRMGTRHQPKQRSVDRHRAWTGFKVRALVKVLRLAGRDRDAARLAAGWAAWCIYNRSEIDSDPVFATHALLALEAAVVRSELHDFLLVWRQTTSIAVGPAGGKAAAEQPPHPPVSEADLQRLSGASSSGDATAVRAVVTAPAPAAERVGTAEGGEDAAGAGAQFYTHDGLPQPFLVSWNVWASHFFTGVYRKLYGRGVSSEAAARQLLARSCRGTIVAEAHALGLLTGVPGAGQAAAAGAAGGKDGAPEASGGGRGERRRPPAARAWKAVRGWWEEAGGVAPAMAAVQLAPPAVVKA